jgi:hypothetical protein
MDLRELMCGGVEYIELNQFQSLVKMVTKV